MVRIGISSCLFGEPVRYDGGHKLDPYLRETLGRLAILVPVCPEVECGFDVPREPMHLEEDRGGPRLVVTAGGLDVTRRMTGWCRRRIGQLRQEELGGFVFKCRSPSCGRTGVPLYREGRATGLSRPGIFAGLLISAFPDLPVTDEEQLRDPVFRSLFLAAAGLGEG